MSSETRALELIERVRARPPAFKDEQITMAHGAGGKASRALVEGLRRAAAPPGVEVVAGERRVSERARGDSMYGTTPGAGRFDPRASLSPASLEPGDRILVSGTVGDHGTAVMLARGEFELDAP